MALHRDAQWSAVPLCKPGDIPTRVRDAGQHFAGKVQQPLTDCRDAQRPDVFLDQRRPIVALQGTKLVRQRRLRQMKPLGSSRQTAAFGQGQQGFEMTQFKGRRGHERDSCC